MGFDLSNKSNTDKSKLPFTSFTSFFASAPPKGQKYPSSSPAPDVGEAMLRLLRNRVWWLWQQNAQRLQESPRLRAQQQQTSHIQRLESWQKCKMQQHSVNPFPKQWNFFNIPKWCFQNLDFTILERTFQLYCFLYFNII